MGTDQSLGIWYAHLDIGTRVMFQAGLITIVLAWMLAVFKRQNLHPKILQWMALIGICIIIWFFTAPHVRFSPGLFPAFFAGGVMLLVDQLFMTRFRSTGIVLIIAAITLSFFIAFHLKNQAINPIIRIELGPALKRMNANPDTYTSYQVDGVKVYYPVSSDQCWNTPLPCAPQPRSRLHLLNPPDIQSGFWFGE